MRWGKRPNFKHHNFNFPGRADLLIWLRPLISSCFYNYSASLRAALYQRPRLLMGFSRFVGICSPPMQNLLLMSWPLTMEMLWDLLDLISIQAQLMFFWSSSSRRLVHDFVVVIVIISSIYALIGGRRSPFFKFFTKKADSLWVTTLKNTFPSTFKRQICWNWLMAEEVFSLGIKILPALCHAFGMMTLLQATFIWRQRYFKTLGVFL